MIVSDPFIKVEPGDKKLVLIIWLVTHHGRNPLLEF